LVILQYASIEAFINVGTKLSRISGLALAVFYSIFNGQGAMLAQKMCARSRGLVRRIAHARMIAVSTTVIAGSYGVTSVSSHSCIAFALAFGIIGDYVRTVLTVNKLAAVAVVVS